MSFAVGPTGKPSHVPAASVSGSSTPVYPSTGFSPTFQFSSPWCARFSA